MNTPKIRQTKFKPIKWLLAVGMAAVLAPWPATAGTAFATGGSQPARPPKTGVLLVNHGSHSATWRQALRDLEATVRPTLLGTPLIHGVKTAHMEYTEPSIATRLKEFDAEGFTDIVIVPVFLSVSSHTFDDIPTIIGQKTDPGSLELMRLEKIERYQPKARTITTPNLDFTGLLKTNVLRRIKSLSTRPDEEGVVMIAYGDATYEREWSALLNDVGRYVKEQTGISAHAHGWCGHVARYNPEQTTRAINEVLQTKQRALVVPVLVAHDPTFQIKIIGGGVERVADHKSRVVYRPDAILPDAGVEQWVVAASLEYAGRIQLERSQTAKPHAKAP